MTADKTRTHYEALAKQAAAESLSVCPHCRLPIEPSQPAKWSVQADNFGFRSSRAPTRRYRVHRICPDYYTKQIDSVNERFDAAVALCVGCQAAIDALNTAREVEIAQIKARAALARVGGAQS